MQTTPVVSVIVPARNEEACLATCLESLVSQTGIAYEIIVVDDASTDRTAEIARSFASGKDEEAVSPVINTTHVGASALTRPCPASSSRDDEVAPPCVAVISAPPLPENWTGKNSAMSAGAKVATGKWLLFTDADTVHKPGSLARAVAEAEAHGAALLSYSPEQEVRTFSEKAVMPVIFAELAATYPPTKVNDPASPIAAANGQYLLISREAYDAVGGQVKIAGDLLEDVAMARLVKSSGRNIFFRYGGDAVRTRMYRTWPQMKEGWTKNLALLFPGARTLAIARGAEFVSIALSLAVSISALSMKMYEVAVVALSLAVIGTVWALNRIRRAHFPFASNLLAACGLGIFAYLLACSAGKHRNSSVAWKGREYGSRGPKAMTRNQPHTSSTGATYK